MNLRGLITRLRQSSVVWSWGVNAFRLAFGVLLLPLLLQLPKQDLGFYFFLISLSAIAPLVDFGLLVALDRNIGYAMAGATELRSHGAPEAPSDVAGPNYALLWKLLRATGYFYRLLAAVVFVLLGAFGTYAVYSRVPETSNPKLTWMAWGLALVCAVLEVYAGWWNVFLRGMNHVLRFTQLTFLSFAIKFTLSYTLLLSGAGLLAVPLASFIAMTVQRHLSRRYCLKLLPKNCSSSISRKEIWELLRVLWPGSWRVGVCLVSYYLSTHAITLLCVKFLGLSTNAEYGLSVQIMTFISGFSQVWLSVKWPVIAQFWAKDELEPMRRVMRSRLWLQHLTFWAGVAVVLPLMPAVLRWVAPGKTLLPFPWLSLLALLFFLESVLSAWNTFIVTGNRMPFMRALVLGNVLGLLMAFILVRLTDLGVGALILAPLACGALYNYWRWPTEGAHLMHVSWPRLMFAPSERAAALPAIGPGPGFRS